MTGGYGTNRTCILLLLCAVGLLAQEKTFKAQQFESWGILKDNAELKLWFMTGFTNGLVTGAEATIQAAHGTAPRFDDAFTSLFKCILYGTSWSFNQAVALTDKYYTEHPEDWHLLMGQGIIKALTVKGSPCDSTAAKKDR